MNERYVLSHASDISLRVGDNNSPSIVTQYCETLVTQQFQQSITRKHKNHICLQTFSLKLVMQSLIACVLHWRTPYILKIETSDMRKRKESDIYGNRLI